MIRNAKNNENEILTGISFSSKKYWNYPDKYFEIWKNELTITPEYILENDVYIHESNGDITGYYSMVHLKNDLNVSNIIIKAGLWLEHMFILPSSINKGIGTLMFRHCIEKYKAKNITRIKILADPNSRFFYEKQGCNYIREYPSTIEGRTTPYLEYLL